MRRIACFLMVSGVLAACGGSDGGGNKDAYVDAIAKSMQDEDSPLDDEQAQCLASEMVDVIGVDAIEEAGVTPDDIANSSDGDNAFEKVAKDLTEEKADALVDVIFDGGCFSFGEFIASQMGEGGPDITDEQAECLGDEFAKNDEFRDAFADSLISGDDPEFDSLGSSIFEMFGTCEINLVG